MAIKPANEITFFFKLNCQRSTCDQIY